MRYTATVCLFLISLSGIAGADDTKPEEIVAKHLDSLGTAEARAAVKSRVLQGTLHFKDLVGNVGNADGSWWSISQQRELNFGMKFGSGPWQNDLPSMAIKLPLPFLRPRTSRVRSAILCAPRTSSSKKAGWAENLPRAGPSKILTTAGAGWTPLA